MKNKTKTYVLLALVLFIWGMIAYKILASLNPKKPSLQTSLLESTFIPKLQQAVDTFSIAMVQRDPFLGTMEKSLVLVKKPKPISVKTETDWMPIQYHGAISKEENKPEVFIVTINGQQYIMKLGQTNQEVRLISGTNSQVIVACQGKRKTILKS